MSEHFEPTIKSSAPRKGLAFSIVVPVYNEEESLETLFTEIDGVMASLQRTYEVIFVDDCSSDRSLASIGQLDQKRPGIIRVLQLTKRSGQTHALRRGLDQAAGDIIITMDADLQNDPADIPKLINELEKDLNCVCVCGWRKARKDTPLKARLSKFGNVLQRLFTGMTIHDVSCTLRAYRHECVGKIALNWDGQHRFIPLSLSLQGYKVSEIVSNHRQRLFGTTKYSHKRIFKVMVDFFRVLWAGGRK